MQFTPSLLQFLRNPLQSSLLILRHNLKQCLKAAFMTATPSATYNVAARQGSILKMCASVKRSTLTQINCNLLSVTIKTVFAVACCCSSVLWICVVMGKMDNDATVCKWLILYLMYESCFWKLRHLYNVTLRLMLPNIKTTTVLSRKIDIYLAFTVPPSIKK